MNDGVRAKRVRLIRKFFGSIFHSSGNSLKSENRTGIIPPVGDIFVLVHLYLGGKFYGMYGLGKNGQAMEGVLASHLEGWNC